MLGIILLLSMFSFVSFSTGDPDNSTDAWTMFRHDPRHTGFSNFSAPISNETALLWSNNTDDAIGFSSPAVFDDWLFIGSKDGYVYAFNSTSGRRIWKSEDFLGGEIRSSPAVNNNIVFVGSTNGTFYALDASTGKRIWSLTLGDGIWASPTIANNTVYIASLNATAAGTVYALTINGTVIWRNSTAPGSNFKSSPAVADGKLFIGSLDRRVYVFDAKTGNWEWNSTQLGGVIRSSPTVSNGKIFIGISNNTLYALNESDGTVIWKNFTQGEINSSPAVAYGKVFVGSEDNKTYAFDENTGNQVWSFTTGGPIDSSPAVANGAVFIGSSDGKIYALNASTGKELWSHQTGGEIHCSPAIANGAVFVGSFDGKIYAFGENFAPHASFTFSPAEIEANQTVTFDASDSYDPDPMDKIVNYTWDFGDGTPPTTESDPIITHVYVTGGNYNVTLVVTDNHGAKSLPETKLLRVKKHEVVILDVSPEVFTVTRGEVLNINVTVKNQGDYDENVTVTAWCSNSSRKIPVDDAQYIALLINQTKTLVFSWDTRNFTRGTYHINATVDGQVKDDGDVTILVHDLVLDDIEVDAGATEILMNRTALIRLTVLNDGDFTEANVTVKVYANSTLIGWNSTSSISKGAYWYPTIKWNTTGYALGNYVVLGHVTPAPDEITLDNNNRTYGIVQVRPPFHDVAVIEVSPSAYNATSGDILNITVSVKNKGDFQSENVTVTVWYSNATTPKPINTTYINVEQNETKIVMVQWNTTGFSGGYYTIGAYANITGLDKYPGNNNKTDGEVLITIQLHDILLAEVKPLKSTAFVWYSMPIYVVFENVGNESMPSFNAYAYANGDQFDSTVVPSLDVGEVEVWWANWEPSIIGNYTIEVYADIADDNLLNNNKTITIEAVMPFHDIAINWLGTTPYTDKVARGRQVTVTVEVENQGAYDETFTVKLYANQTSNANITLLDTANVQLDYLDPPLNITLTWNTMTFMPETYKIFANITVLPNEEDTSNNHREDGAVEVTPGVHDIAVIGSPLPSPVEKRVLCLSPCPPPPNEPLYLTANISVSIRNSGSFAENINITIYLIDIHEHQTPPVGTSTIFNLLPDETRTVIVEICVLNNSGIEKGVYKIKATAGIPNDANPNNNNATSWWILNVTMTGDINGTALGYPDGKVDIIDVANVALRFGYSKEDQAYVANCDIFYDGTIDIVDVAIAAINFGKIDP